MVVAREVLKDYRPIDAMFPDYLHDRKVEAAMQHCGAALAQLA
jgi:hypothetical protein